MQGTRMPQLSAHIRDRQRIRAGLLIALCAGLADGGCASPGRRDFGNLPTITSADPKAETALQRARTLEEQGHTDAAAEQYKTFVAAHAGDPLVPVAELELGRILLKQNKNAEANTLFERVARHHAPALAEQGRFYGAVTAHRLGNHLAAVGVLQKMIGRPIDPADTRLLLRTLSEALIALGRAGEAIVAVDALAADAGAAADAPWVLAQLALLTRQKATAAEIERLVRELDHDGAAWRLVIRRAVHDADAAGSSERARELLEIMRGEDLPIDADLGAIAMRAERPAEANPQVVGAVLSLSGRGRKVGELSLRGLMLAAGLPPSGPKAANAPQLVFRDDGGDPARAAEAVTDLVTVHRAIAIIGPLDVRAADGAAARAQELGVPIVLLSPGGKPTEQGPMVYRFFATPSNEIQALISRAKTIDRSRIAALLPDGAFGDLMETTLRTQANALGTTVTAVVRYPPATASFVAQAQALQKETFDALLLADSASQVALIAPALAAAGLWCTPPGEASKEAGRAISVMAPSIAFDHTLAVSTGRYLQGAFFSVPFDAQTATGEGRKFVERFSAQFGEVPNAFSVFAYDAYKLVRKAIDGGDKTRASLALNLWHAQSTELAGPSPGLLPDREAERATRIMELKGDHFEAAHVGEGP
jgi:ABC-type branched-subunit amino acid transport system substrate-binding protein